MSEMPNCYEIINCQAHSNTDDPWGAADGCPDCEHVAVEDEAHGHRLDAIAARARGDRDAERSALDAIVRSERLTEGDVVAVHEGPRRVPGIVKRLGNATGPLVVVIECPCCAGGNDQYYKRGQCSMTADGKAGCGHPYKWHVDMVSEDGGHR